MTDDQDRAELFDDDTAGGDAAVDDELDDGHLHVRLVAPDEGGPDDDVAELVASEVPADYPLSAEEAAMHYEDH